MLASRRLLESEQAPRRLRSPLSHTVGRISYRLEGTMRLRLLRYIPYWAMETCLICLVTAPLLLVPGCTKTLHQDDLFRPWKFTVVPDGVARDNIEIMASDSTALRGWCLRPENPKGYLVYFYGGGSAVIGIEWRLYWLAERYHVTVFAVDYRGCGFSDGSADAPLLFEDAVTVYDALRERATNPPGPVLIWGKCLGSFMALHVAAVRPIDGLILESTATNVREALPNFRRRIPWYARWAVRLRLGQDLLDCERDYGQPVETIARLSVPVLIVHGDADELFPLSLARRMYDSCPSEDKALCIAPGAGHNVEIQEKGVVGCVDNFMRKRVGATSD